MSEPKNGLDDIGVVFKHPEFEHKDKRRRLRQILTAEIQQINSYECKKGAILGNHYHRETFEWFYVVYGKIKLICETNDGSALKSKEIHSGIVFCVEPFMTHSIECLTDCCFMTFLNKAYDHENPDIHKENV